MTEKVVPRINVPKFEEHRYLEENSDARLALQSGEAESAFEHYVRVGIDENRAPRLKRVATNIKGAIERTLISDSGFFLLLGWMDDEGRDASTFWFLGGEFNVQIPSESIFRFARRDVETAVKEGAFDFGFLIFGHVPSKFLLQQPFLVQATSSTGSFQGRTEPGGRF